MEAELYDVVAVNLETRKARLIAEKKTERNADATLMMAVMRRGVEKEFFEVVPSGTVLEGQDWIR